MNFFHTFSLLPYNTFGIDVQAEYFAEIFSVNDLKLLLADEKYRLVPKLILGGGSNLLFTGDFKGLVIRNRIPGMKKLRENEEHIWVKSGGGEIWHDFVCWCIDRNYAGVENLSLIPGSVGAAPIQNIGAYGVELKDVFHELEAVNLGDGNTKIFSRDECAFGYRDSIFKREARNKFIISSVTFRLNKKPELHTGYGAIQEELNAMHVENAGIRDVSQAVINIRRSKLPDPARIGNAGSFFKNPEVPEPQYEILKNKFPDLIAYKSRAGFMKLSAGWMIEQSGWKGLVSGHVGMHNKQALVLVNYGGASGEELIAHAKKVQLSIREKFGVDLEMEVNIV